MTDHATRLTRVAEEIEGWARVLNTVRVSEQDAEMRLGKAEEELTAYRKMSALVNERLTELRARKAVIIQDRERESRQ